MKPRSDSLYAKLATADPSLALRGWVFYAAIIEGKSLEEIGGTLHDKGVSTSQTAVGEMLSRHTLRWKLDQSRERARTLDGWKPDKKKGTLPEQIRKNIAKQIFNLSMDDLTAKETIALHRTMLAERSLNIQLYDIQTECASIVGEVLKGGARAQELKTLAAEKGLSGKDYVEAIRQKVYGEIAAPLPQAEERGAA